MSIALYMDHHVHSGITEGLRRREVDVVTAFEDGRSKVDDEALLERACQLGRVLFSQDRDLLGITADWLHEVRDFSGLVYAHLLQVSIGKAVEDLELIAKVAGPAEMKNCVIRLPL